MKIREARQIRDCQQFLNSLYGPENQDKSWQQLFGFLAESAGYLCKVVDTERLSKRHFLRSISWLFTLSTKLEIDVQSSFARRFPGVCPYCVQPQCVCFRTDKQAPKNMPSYKVQQELEYLAGALLDDREKILDLKWASKNISIIFPQNEIAWHYSGPTRHLRKMWEELAELHEATNSCKFGKKPKNVVEEEVADFLAWVVGAWEIVYPDLSLQDAFIDYYMKNCPVCSQLPCACGIGKNRAEGLVDAADLLLIKDNLEKLISLMPSESERLGELLKSAEEAEKSQSEASVAHASKQIITTIKEIEQTTNTVGRIGENVSRIMLLILTTADKIHKLSSWL